MDPTAALPACFHIAETMKLTRPRYLAAEAGLKTSPSFTSLAMPRAFSTNACSGQNRTMPAAIAS
eukprot:11199896-Lingulodinium_polyedra.AAC.1